MMKLPSGIPGKWIICSGCEGHGMRLNRSIGEYAYSMEEFNEAFDEEEREEYFKPGGRYDVQCDECDGSGKVLEPDVSACSFSQKRVLVELRRAARWQEEDRRAHEAEVRMGC